MAASNANAGFTPSIDFAKTPGISFMVPAATDIRATRSLAEFMESFAYVRLFMRPHKTMAVNIPFMAVEMKMADKKRLPARCGFWSTRIRLMISACSMCYTTS